MVSILVSWYSHHTRFLPISFIEILPGLQPTSISTPWPRVLLRWLKSRRVSCVIEELTARRCTEPLAHTLPWLLCCWNTTGNPHVKGWQRLREYQGHWTYSRYFLSFSPAAHPSYWYSTSLIGRMTIYASQARLLFMVRWHAWKAFTHVISRNVSIHTFYRTQVSKQCEIP